MSIVGSNALAGASGQAGGAAAGYQIERSLRFNGGYLNRTPSSAGNLKTWTLSFWMKRTSFPTDGTQNGYIFNSSNTGNNNHSMMRFQGQDVHQLHLYLYEFTTEYGAWDVKTARKYRDPSAWYHIVIAMDTTQATAADRLKIFTNGVRETEFASAGYPAQNQNAGQWNSGFAHRIGRPTYGGGNFDGYLADINFIDGQALDPTDFGEYDDNNNWNPKDTSGLTFGTNGFRLSFSDNSSNSALGTDAAGSNDWTVNNIQAAATFGWPSTTWSDDISIDSGNYYFTSSTGPTKSFDGNSSTYTDVRRGDNPANTNTTTIIWTPTGGISGVTKIRIHSQYATGYRINEGTWTSFSSVGSYTQIYSGTAFTLTKLETRNTNCPGPTYGHRVTSYEINDVEVKDNVVESGDASGIDSLIDTPTNYEADSGNNGGNYCTWNPIDSTGTNTLTNGNLDSSGAKRGNRGTISVTSGKYYYETVMTSSGGGGDFGWSKSDEPCPTTDPGATSYGWSVHTSGLKRHNGSTSSYISGGLAVGDVIQFAIDVDAGKVWFGKNNTWGASGDPAAGTNAAFTNVTGPIAPAHGNGGSSVAFTTNFGQRPFAYTPPTGYLSLCTTNLPDPTIADGSTAFDVALWTGNGSTAQTISTPNLSPDMVWVKERSSTSSHAIIDAVRGSTNAAKVIYPDRTDAEVTANSTQSITSLNSDGFTIGSSDNSVNESGQTYVGWAWDGGTSTVSNTDGSITSSVRANASAGFSIVSYTGNGTIGATVGHGLGANVALYFLKNRSNAADWPVLGHALNDAFGGSNKYLLLNSIAAAGNAGQGPGNSSTIELYDDATNNTNGDNYIAYCFAPVESFSAFGHYVSNNNVDGPFVYLGFQPKLIMWKNVDASHGWYLYDDARDPDNPMSKYLAAHDSIAEGDPGGLMDVLSNGFKVRNTGLDMNTSSNRIIYMAWAEHPFKTARAR